MAALTIISLAVINIQGQGHHSWENPFLVNRKRRKRTVVSISRQRRHRPQKFHMQQCSIKGKRNISASEKRKHIKKGEHLSPQNEKHSDTQVRSDADEALVLM